MKTKFLPFLCGGSSIEPTEIEDLTWNESAYVIFSIIVVIILTLLCVFLFIKIRKSIKESYERKFDKALIPLNAFKQYVNIAAEKPEAELKYNLFQVDVCDFDSLKRSLGEDQLGYLFKEISKAIMKIVPWGVKVGVKSEKSLFVLIHADKHTTADLISKLILKNVAKEFKIGSDLTINVNINIASVKFPEFGNNFDKLNDCLEIAMVRASRQGNNKYAIYNQQFFNENTEQYQYYQEIRNAIKAKEFILHYQPIVDSNTYEVVSCEAFIRWLHKERGLLSPAEFLGIMEQTGDIYWVGLWCFEQLLARYSTWTTGYDSKFSVRLNFSAIQLQNENLFEEMKKLIRKYKFQPELIILEIEDMSLYNVSSIFKNNVDNLKNLGVKICIDNFGDKLVTPTSIQDFPITSIKFNKKYWESAKNSTMVANIIKIVIEYSKEQNIQVIAHGVETIEDAEFLRNLGINYMQGYLFNKPKEPGEFISDVIFTPWVDKIKNGDVDVHENVDEKETQDHAERKDGQVDVNENIETQETQEAETTAEENAEIVVEETETTSEEPKVEKVAETKEAEVKETAVKKEAPKKKTTVKKTENASKTTTAKKTTKKDN